MGARRDVPAHLWLGEYDCCRKDIITVYVTSTETFKNEITQYCILY